MSDLDLTVENVLALNPCKKYTRAYVTELFNGRESVHLADAIVEAKIPYNDRIWLIEQCLNKNEYSIVLIQWVIYYAEDVLPIFEKAYPQDKRPRLAIQAAKDYQADLISLEALQEAQNAAWSAYDGYSYAALAYGAALAYAIAYMVAHISFVCTAFSRIATSLCHIHCIIFTNDSLATKQEQYLTKLAELLKI